MLITKEDLVTHFCESNDTLTNFLNVVNEAYKEAEATRNANLIKKLELFAKENNMSLDQVKELFAPKVKAGKTEKGTAKTAPERDLYIYDLDGKKFGIMRGSKGKAHDEMTRAIASGQTKEEMKARGAAASEAVKTRVGDSTTPVDITDLPESA